MAVLTPCGREPNARSTKGPGGAAVKDCLASLRGATTTCSLGDRELHVSGCRPSDQAPPRGVTVRHGRSCPAREGGPCQCRPPTSPRSSRPGTGGRSARASLRFPRRGPGAPTPRPPFRRAPARPDAHLARRSRRGLALCRSGGDRPHPLGDPDKPSALRSYEEPLQTKALPELGHLRLSAVDRVAVQDLVDRLVARGLAPSTVRNSVLTLRAVFRRAVARSEVIKNPTLGLSLPS